MHRLYWFVIVWWFNHEVMAHVRLSELVQIRSTTPYVFISDKYNECPSEDFEHTYQTKGDNETVILQQHMNFFRATQKGKNATMRDLCLDNRGLPVRRLCKDNNGIATWEQLQNVSCQADNKVSWELNQLHEELLRGDDAEIILTRLWNSLSEATDQLTPVDVYITAQILTSLLDEPQHDGALSANLINVCSEIMNMNETVLRLSVELNATNALLDSFEKYMDSLSEYFVPNLSCGNVALEAARESIVDDVELINYADVGVFALISSNLSVFYVNPYCENITGVAFYSAASSNRMSSSGDFWYRFLYFDESLPDLQRESDLETAVYLPQQLWRQLQKEGASHLVIKVYAKDALFMPTLQKRNQRIRSKVLSVSIPEFRGNLLHVRMPCLLSKPKQLSVACRQWNYENWQYGRIITRNNSNAMDSTVICEVRNMAQFTAGKIHHRNVQLQWQDREHTTKVQPIPYCKAEDFEHTYELKADIGSVIFERNLNHFRTTKVGDTAKMRDFCIDSNGLPVLRLCADVNGTATWEQLQNVSCQTDDYKYVSQKLNNLYEDLLSGRESPEDVLSSLEYNLNTNYTRTPFDVYITAEIFKLLVENKKYNTDLAAKLITICSRIMDIDENVLRQSTKVNATKTLLDNFEQYMDGLSTYSVADESCGIEVEKSESEWINSDVVFVDNADIGVQAMISQSLSVFYLNPVCENITGLAFYSNAGLDRRELFNSWYRHLYANESLEHLKHETDLDFAAYVPEHHWKHLRDTVAFKIVLRLYDNDALFANTSMQYRRQLHNQILSITNTGHQTINLTQPVHFSYLNQLGDSCSTVLNQSLLDLRIRLSYDSNVWCTYVPCGVQYEVLESSNSQQNCAAENFEHTYQIVEENDHFIYKTHMNHFKQTNLNTFATMKDLCLDSSGLPVQRLCKDNNGTATWEQLHNVNCTAGNPISKKLNKLHDDMVSGRQSQEVILTQLEHSVSQAVGQLQPVDVYNTANIFSLIDASKDNSTALGANLINVCREIMKVNETVLRLSAELNATNVLLDNFEKNIDALTEHLVSDKSCGKTIDEAARESREVGVELINNASIGVQALISSNLSVFYVNLACNNITGMAIYSDHKSSSGNYTYSFLYAGDSVESLMTDSHLETAAYLPEQLWRYLRDKGASYFVLKVYANDALFVETSLESKPRPDVKVLSITIPGFDSKLPSAVHFVLRKPNQVGVVCAYWNYVTWRKNGITTASNMFDDIVLCQSEHLTQFSALLGNDDLPEPHKTILKLFTYFGCGLSLFGMLGIFLTAALVSKWREQPSTKVLLHLCLALSLQLILFLWLTSGSWSNEENWTRCWISGAALQYSVLVIFSWMLIIALLQYQRYVTVLGADRPHHYIFISGIVAWTLPLLPTLLIVFLDQNSYRPTQKAFCYPAGKGLLLGVVLPIAIVTASNALTMIRIVYSVNQTLRPRSKPVCQHIGLFVLLFFLLGISWIFGLLSYLKMGIIYSYLFCMTATLQGLVLFFYTVLFNATHRLAWLKFICPKLVKVASSKNKTQASTFSTSSSKQNTLKVN